MDGGALLQCRELLEAFTKACAFVRKVALKRHSRHQATLHALCYPTLCPPRGPGLPSQYAVRAISRVSHQLRQEALKLPDPYPEQSFDLDANILAWDPEAQSLTITSLEARGVRGLAARGYRVHLGGLGPHLRTWLDHRFQGGTLVLPAGPGAKPFLLARLGPRPEPEPKATA